MKPPRALWVPFPLGRPLGGPGDPKFQRGVLMAALRLLESERGPVLADYPLDAPDTASDLEGGWSCPLPLPAGDPAASEFERRLEALRLEISLLAPWFEEGLARRGRTAFGLSGLHPDAAEQIARVLASLAAGEDAELPQKTDEPFPLALRAIVDDMKAFYTEAALSQPSRMPPGPQRLARWLYHETLLGRVLYDLRDRLASSEDPRTRGVGIIPTAYRQRPPHFQDE
jgi:hypothetical protein